MGKLVHACNPSIVWQKQEESEFGARLGYIVNLKQSCWTAINPFYPTF